MFQDGFKQRTQIGGFIFHLDLRDASSGIGVDHRKIELILMRVEIDEQIVNFVEHFLDAGVGTINFVDDENRRQLGFERLRSEHSESGAAVLRSRPPAA